ncbi:DNA-methyltransferase [Corynebacterium variabile]|uniref:DNA-methyltransferase n=1 Tax=Corynebacterium variabile TaxID=1727 RepID=UPI00289D26C7|nr:DNA methyltransferase [Corynebacterium variabile]
MSDKTTLAFPIAEPAPTGSVDLRHGDCLEVLRSLDDNSVDSVTTDPPYGLSNTKPAQVADVLAAWVTGDTEAVPAKKGGFMGADWDSFVPPPAVWAECLRVLKPGGHMAVFAGARTQDLMGLAIRLAGFEIRDTLGWIQGAGFPKSMDVSKAIDKAAGAEREVVGTRKKLDSYGQQAGNNVYGGGPNHDGLQAITIPASDAARQWSGWGTALKPAIEPIILARKPLDGTVAANVLAHGVGGLNIDGCRVSTDEKLQGSTVRDDMRGGAYGSGAKPNPGDIADYAQNPAGRFPANVLLDEHAAKEMDEQSGMSVSRANTKSDERGAENSHIFASASLGRRDQSNSHNDSGGASRFFPVFKYQAKAPKKERPVIVRENGTKIAHPTVKPLALMSWLVTLITPEGGTTLDPFAGTGTTLQAALDKGFNAIGVEQDEDYIQLIGERLGWSAA